MRGRAWRGRSPACGGDLLQARAGGDLVLEGVGLAVQRREAEDLSMITVQDHSEAQRQAEHDQLHHPVGAHEQATKLKLSGVTAAAESMRVQELRAVAIGRWSCARRWRNYGEAANSGASASTSPAAGGARPSRSMQAASTSAVAISSSPRVIRWLMNRRGPCTLS